MPLYWNKSMVALALRRLGALLVVLVLLAGGQAGHAQRGLYLGLQGGPHVSWLANLDASLGTAASSSPFYCTQVGLNLRQQFTPHSAFQLGVLHQRVGQHWELDSLNLTETQRLTYFKIPLLYRYTFRPHKWVNYYVGAGVQISLLADVHRDLAGLDTLGTPTPNFDFDQLFYEATLDAVLLAGVAFRFTPRLSGEVGLRFDHSLTDVEDASYKSLEASRAYHRSVGLQVGVQWLIHRRDGAEEAAAYQSLRSRRRGGSAQTD